MPAEGRVGQHNNIVVAFFYEIVYFTDWASVKEEDIFLYFTVKWT